MHPDASPQLGREVELPVLEVAFYWIQPPPTMVSES